MTGSRPSSGKLYPFLHELRDRGYVTELATDDVRGRVKYRLTEKGEKLVEEIVERMGNIIDARLDMLLEQCHHCGVKLYDVKVFGKDSAGNQVSFCCTHCRDAYRSH